MLGCPVLHADETPVAMLDPGAGKTKKAYVWAYARSTLDGGPPGVIYEFCAGRGSQYPIAFLGGQAPPYAEPAWCGTLVCDQYAGYNAVLDAKVYPQRKAAACAAHARRRFEELSCGGDMTTNVGVGKSAPKLENTLLKAGITKIMITAVMTKATTMTAIG